MEELRKELTDEELNEIAAGGNLSDMAEQMKKQAEKIAEYLKKHPIQSDVNSGINPKRSLLDEDSLAQVSGGLEVNLRKVNKDNCNEALLETDLLCKTAQVVEPTMAEHVKRRR